MAMYVGLDVSLRTTSICVVEADGSLVWAGKAESEPASLIKALTRWRGTITLVGIEACPLSEWLYGALVECGFHAVCIETRHAALPLILAYLSADQVGDLIKRGRLKAVLSEWT